jgi:hypothetical protein
VKQAGANAGITPDARAAALGRVAGGVLAAPLRRRSRAARGELAIVERAARRMVLGRRVR